MENPMPRLLFALLAFIPACVPDEQAYEERADAIYGPGPDLSPLCTSNNDGVIERSEEAFPIGVSVNYLFNPPGTTISVDPDGEMTPDGHLWDLRSTAGEVHQLTLLAVSSMWFADSFPDGDYTAITDIGTNTMGIFKATDNGVYILGYASQEPNQTLLVYDTPILSLRFPMRLGDSYVSTATISNGKIMGQTIATKDTYRVEVDQSGTVLLPFFQLDKTLRVHVTLTQATPGGFSITHIQHIFFHECAGEIGRMVSQPNETDPSFKTASEFRRVAL
jgi:hypothetical protein